jgi:hypothetical protein
MVLLLQHLVWGRLGEGVDEDTNMHGGGWFSWGFVFRERLDISTFFALSLYKLE